MEIRRGRASEWNLYRQLAGNLVPFAHWLPTFLVAWLLIRLAGGNPLANGLVLTGVVLSLTFGTWALFDRYAMFQNAAMRRALRPRLFSSLSDPPPADRCWFVGLATQSHFGWLDTDEDVGYLVLFPDRLIYIGDRYSLFIPRPQVLGIDRTPVPFYALLGYYWTVIRFENREGEATSVRILSREVDRVLSQQRAANHALWEGVRDWYQETGAALMNPGGHEGTARARQEALQELAQWLEPQSEEPEQESTSSAREAAVSGPAAAERPAGQAAGALAHQVRELLDSGAEWGKVEPKAAAFLRSMDEPDALRANHELMLGVYLALRRRGDERAALLQPLPGDAALATDEPLTEEYERDFGEPPLQGGGDSEAAGSAPPPWVLLRQGRRLQALFARRAMRELLERDRE